MKLLYVMPLLCFLIQPLEMYLIWRLKLGNVEVWNRIGIFLTKDANRRTIPDETVLVGKNYFRVIYECKVF